LAKEEYFKWATHAISLMNNDMKNVHTNTSWNNGQTNPNHLCLYFDDVISRANSKHPPEMSHILVAFNFVSKLPTDAKLLIHCQAGISRSTAMAIAIAVYKGLTPENAIKYVYSIRPQMQPNPLMIKQADSILELDGKLKQAMQTWADAHGWGGSIYID
jgi:predicted protein tyrosine phosphatase